MREVFTRESEDLASLVRKITDALAAARFTDAHAAVEQMPQYSQSPATRLFAAHTRLRLAAYQEQQIENGALADELDLAFEALNNAPGDWPSYWYVLGWLMLPFASGRKIDIYYQMHLAGQLQLPALRQELLAYAAYYGMEHREYGFMTFLRHHYPFDEDWVWVPFYQAMLELFLAIYQRMPDQISQAAESMHRTAENPLHVHLVSTLSRKYEHLIAS